MAVLVMRVLQTVVEEGEELVPAQQQVVQAATAAQA